MSYNLLLIVFLLGCTKDGTKLRQQDSIQEENEVFSDSLKKELIEEILNLPDVIRYSRIDLVRRKYDSIYLCVLGDSLMEFKTPIYQNQKPIVVLSRLGKIDPSKDPCYVFEKFSIDKNEAYVLVFFDLTGAIAYGKLFRDGHKWVPAKDFLIGVR